METTISKNRPSEVIYQIYPASFKDSGHRYTLPAEQRVAGDEGFGDLRGITDKLQYVKELGVDAIWISPFFLSPKGEAGDGGYAISNYREIDPRFGTMEDFKDLIQKAHELGLRVYTDFVLCHTSNEHEWFKASHDPKHSEHEKYKDFYVWHDGKRDEKGFLLYVDEKGNERAIRTTGDKDVFLNQKGERFKRDERGIFVNERGEAVAPEFVGDHGQVVKPKRPNNWQSVFNGQPAWSWDDTRQQYYLHHFNTSQPALNLNSPDGPDGPQQSKVLKASLGEMEFWFDKGVDGLRIDALPFANYDPEFRDNPQRGPRNDPNWEKNWGSQDFEHSMCQVETEKKVLPAIRALMNSPKYKIPNQAGPNQGGKKMVVEAIAGPWGGDGDVMQASKYIDLDKGGADSAYTNAIVRLFYEKHEKAPNDSRRVDRYPPIWEVRDMIRENLKYSRGGGFCNNLGNHDFPRYGDRAKYKFPDNPDNPDAWNPEKNRIPEALHPNVQRQLMFLVASLPGSLCLYNGDELGLGNATEKDLRGKKQDLLFGKANRDGCRTPMPWKAYSKNMGFSEHNNPYLPVPESHQIRAVDRQEMYRDSMLNVTRRMLQQRKDNPALNCGTTTLLETYDPIVAFVRETKNQANEEENQAVLCVFNMSGQHERVVPWNFKGMTPELREKLKLTPGQEISIPPYESSFHGLRHEQDLADEVGMKPAQGSQPMLVEPAGVNGAGKHKTKMFATDMLITDLHISAGPAVETALEKIINGRKEHKGDSKIIVRGKKASITQKEYEVLVKAYQQDNELAKAPEPEKTAGGSTSCALATLKSLVKEAVDICLMGFAPDNEDGSAIKGYLKGAGIKVQGYWPEGLPEETAISLIINHADGEHTILTYRGKEEQAYLESQKRSLTAVPVEKRIRESDIVYLSESTLEKFGLPFIQNILKWRWLEQKQLVLVLPTHASFGATSPSEFRKWTPSCNILMGNDVEFCRIFDKETAREDITPEQMGRVIKAIQADFSQNALENPEHPMPCPKEQVAFITCGTQPALLVTKTKVIPIPVPHVDSSLIINRLGAGNAAFAGFLAGYIRGYDHETSARLAIGLSVEKIQQNKDIDPENMYPVDPPFLINPEESVNRASRRVGEIGEAARKFLSGETPAGNELPSPRRHAKK